MLNILLTIIGKLIVVTSRLFNLGHGSTWPGHIALMINPNFIRDILRKNFSSNEVRSSRSARTISDLKIILIAGTNGKTTTGKLIQTILEKANYRVFHNESGANLLNGIASTMLLHSSILSTINYDYAIFEVDEATLPLALKEIAPDYLILLNLFRDQLDRYGEVNTIVNKWADAIRHLSPKTRLILNADDPQIAHLARHSGKRSQVPSGTWRSASRISISNKRFWTRRVPDGNPSSQNDGFAGTALYFGLNDKTFHQTSHQHAVDSTYCPNCSSKLHYNSIYYSHLGDWECKNCELKRPNLDISNIEYYPTLGIHNRYNTLASVLLAKQIGIEQKNINSALHSFTPAFGRQEILNVEGKRVQIFLSKNPTSFNESLRTIADLNAKNVLLVLNDRIPDGRDVSWIWDVDFEDYVENYKNIIITGDRCYDMGLRIKYASKFSIFNFQFSMKNSNFNFQIEKDLKIAIALSLKHLPKSEILYILPTYSAMLETRKILTGKKIL